MRNSIHQLGKLFALLSAVTVLVMMLLTTADVCIRWFTGRSIPGAQEMSESFMVVIVFFGLAYALYCREHVAVTVLTSRLSLRLANILRFAGKTVMIGLVAWMLWETGQEAHHAFVSGEVRFGLLRIPLWPARLAIPVGLTVFLLQALVDILDEASLLRKGRQAADTPQNSMEI